MARLLQAADALSRANGVNQGLDAVVSMLIASDSAPNGRDIGEVLWALHDQLQTYLDEIGRAIKD